MTFAKRALGGALFAFCGTIGAAQNVQFSVSDAGVGTHTSHGTGIEIQIEPSQTIPGDAVTGAMLAQLCNHFAPSIVPFVQDEADLPAPDFVAVRLFTGDGGLRRDHAYQAFTLVDGTCGAPK